MVFFKELKSKYFNTKMQRLVDYFTKFFFILLKFFFKYLTFFIKQCAYLMTYLLNIMFNVLIPTNSIYSILVYILNKFLFVFITIPWWIYGEFLNPFIVVPFSKTQVGLNITLLVRFFFLNFSKLVNFILIGVLNLFWIF